MPVSGLILHERDLPLMVDLYELAMAQAYWVEGMHDRAVFSLFFRKLPERRNFVLACGQQAVARVIRSLRFTDTHLERLTKLELFKPEFLSWLKAFRFSGDLHAVREGTPLFPQEPLLEIEAPIIEAQILESLVMNFVHLETVLATKAVRLVWAARGKPVVDFGMRRMHGLDAAYRGVRAYRIGGLAATSNVLAGQDFGLPVRGTMAHSYIQAHTNELQAFKTYAQIYPGTVLLVDTYDTKTAVAGIIAWLKSEPDVRISALRLDSGDLAAEARMCRNMLDAAGLEAIQIFASGGLNEDRILGLVQAGAPVDGFGVGTDLGVAIDSPTLDLAYKLTHYADQPRMKSSTGKVSYPGRKQVYRKANQEGVYVADQLTLRNEVAEGQALLAPTMLNGELVAGAISPLGDAADAAQQAIARLPTFLRQLERPATDFPVHVSSKLRQLQRDTLAKLRS